MRCTSSRAAATVLVGAAITLLAVATGTNASDPIMALDNTPGVTWSRGSARDLATWWRAVHDLVFLGRYESCQRDTSRWSEGDLVRCHVDSILRGYSADSVVVFSRVLEPSFAAERLRAGSRVLVRLTRRCGARSSSCGDFMLVSEDDTLLSDHISAEQGQQKLHDPRPLRLQDLPVDVLRGGDVDDLLGASDGVAIVSLSENRAVADTSIVWRCSHPSWVVPSRDSVPSWVLFPRKEYCYAEGSPVRYLIPVPKGFLGDTLRLDCCPRVLAVKDSVATGIGLTLAELPQVMRRRADGRLELLRPTWLGK